jgi:hypothetical protein
MGDARAAGAAMMKSVPPSRRIELLLNTLLAERYARRPLLAEVVEELAMETGPSEAVRVGRELLERLDSGIDEREFEGCVEKLIAMTQRARPSFRA